MLSSLILTVVGFAIGQILKNLCAPALLRAKIGISRLMSSAARCDRLFLMNKKNKRDLTPILALGFASTGCSDDLSSRTAALERITPQEPPRPPPVLHEVGDDKKPDLGTTDTAKTTTDNTDTSNKNAGLKVTDQNPEMPDPPPEKPVTPLVTTQPPTGDEVEKPPTPPPEKPDPEPEMEKPEIPPPPKPHERPSLPDTTPEGRRAFRFTPDDIPDDEEPTGLARYLISGQAWIMPYEGPLEMTWALQKETPDVLISRETSIGPEITADEAKAMIKRAMAEFEAAANIKFTEANSIDEADFGFFFGRSILSGAFSPSNNIAMPLVTINTRVEFYSTIVHELGHVLGLSHPFQPEGGWPGLEQYRTGEGSELSVMSYNADEHTGETGLQAADIEALQFLYGKPGTNWQSPERYLAYDTNIDDGFSPIWGAFHPAFPDLTYGDLLIVKVEEGISTDIAIFDGQAHEPDNYAYRFELPTGIRDNDLFTINADGLIYFKQTPDFENPHDTSGGAKFGYNNLYEINGHGTHNFGRHTVSYPIDILVEVTDVLEIV